MIWNKRITRIAVGLLLLACATLAILPSVTGHTSVDGTVNARFVTLSAPIEGTVQKTPPKAGTFIPGYGYVTGIKNERINRQVVASLEAELQTARRRLDAYKSQKQELSGSSGM